MLAPSSPSTITSLATSWSRIRKIGLFDSGLGGLSVLRSFLARPESRGKEFIYVGDTLRCPYGDRPEEEISLFVRQMASWLLQQDIDLLVMACNTSAALVRDELIACSAAPVLDLLESTAGYIGGSALKNVGVIATASTARRQAFTKSIKASAPNVDVVEIGCPLLVPVVEAGLADSDEALNALRPYVEQLLQAGVDSIVYGCTHYPFLENSLRRALKELNAEHVEVIDPAEQLTGALFGARPMLVPIENENETTRRLVTTGDANNFARIASRCLGYDIGEASSISIKELQTALTWQTSRNSSGSGKDVSAPMSTQLSPGAVS